MSFDVSLLLPVMRAHQILHEMCAEYTSLGSYSDAGTVVRSGQSMKVTFRTHFQRPYLFRFEWTCKFRDRLDCPRTSRHVLWCDGVNTFECDDGEDAVVVQGIDLGIAKATGVSMGAAHTISAMLLEEVGGFLFTDLEQVSLSEKISGDQQIYLIEGYHPNGDPCELSLGADDLLLREVKMADNDGLVTTEMRNTIRVNETIDREIFSNGQWD